jgi:NAD(P)-dependent dehydrogenase (short-subunit alcohol dehydrogenase family)
LGGLVVITGAAGALGRAMVSEFLDGGKAVVALDRAGAALDALTGEATAGRLHTIAADLTVRNAVEAAWREIDDFGQTQALVNVAGGFAPGSLADTDESTLASMLDVNVATALWSCQAAAGRLAAHGGGAIVNIGARSAVSGGAPVGYALAKAAVVRLTQVLADELRPQRIRVNAVLPSVIDTPANRAAFSAETIRRAVAPRAIAKVVGWLCSDDAWPINGAAIPVYGDA